MLEVLEESESFAALGKLLELTKSSPELVSQENLFRVLNHAEGLEVIKGFALDKIRSSLGSLEEDLQVRGSSPFKHFWSMREVQMLAVPRDLTSLSRVKKFISEVEVVIEPTKENRDLLHCLEDVQKVLEGGYSLRKKNHKGLQETIEEVIEEAESLEKGFALFVSSLFSMVNHMEWVEVKQGLVSSAQDGTQFLSQVDRVIALLYGTFAEDEKPIGDHLGFGWGIFLTPVVSSFEESPISVETGVTYQLYEELIRARQLIETHQGAFSHWITEEKVKELI